jgi:SRSO17 transposase
MAFAADFTPFFRTVTRDGSGHARAYLCGLFQGQRGRKNMERMEEEVPGLNYQGVQQFITDSPWESAPLMAEVASQADGLLGGASDSRLVVDECANSKKGVKSVGVGRQYNGNLGKTDNCQVAVFAALSAGRLVAPVGTRLYLPKDWCEDAARCQEAGVPEEARRFQTKPELALALVAEARARGLRFGMVCADGGYGQHPGFLRALDVAGETFVIEVHRDQRVYCSLPWPEVPEGKVPAEGKPRRRRKQQGGTAVRIDEWVAGLEETEWERRKIRESTRGWVEVHCVSRRMWLWDGREEQPRLWWVLAWQNPDEGPGGRIHYALSNAGADADPDRLISHGVHRYWVERSFQDAKSEAGMGDYQTRGWTAWHHHMALVMLMMLFILKEKVLHAVHTPELPLSAGDIVFVLSQMLPQRVRDFEDICTMVELRRRKRLTDQRHRRRKATREKPPLGPLEDLTK